MNGEYENKTENLIAAAIDMAEDVRDPLEGLVEKTSTDPGAPFVPDALERIAALKKDDRAAFEVLRGQLKNAGCRVTALDEAIAEETGDTGGRGPKQADMLIELAQSAELFHAADGNSPTRKTMTCTPGHSLISLVCRRDRGRLTASSAGRRCSGVATDKRI